MSLLKTLALTCATLLPTVAAADWSGYYAGGSIGSATNLSYEITGDVNDDVEFDDSTSFGGFFGTRSEANGFVLGGELAIEAISDAELSDGDVTFTVLLDLKLTAGAPVGDSALVYGILSVSSGAGTYFTNDINAGGFGLGAGAAFMLSENVSISGEYISRSLTQEFDIVDIDVKADTLTLRAAYHF